MCAIYFEQHELANFLLKAKAYRNYTNLNQTTSTQSVIEARLPLDVFPIMNFAKQIPGLTEIQNTFDFANMIDSSLFDYLIVNNIL